MLNHCDDRLLNSLSFSCQGPILEALDNPEVVELMLNPDCKFWVERYGHDHEHIADIPAEKSRMILSLVASAHNTIISHARPALQGNFPLDGSRFQGTFPPIVANPSFSIRKLASRVFSLGEYVATGSIKQKGVDIIHEAVSSFKNIMVVGGTSSGKTTFTNAVINAIAELTPHSRVIINQDTPELQSRVNNTVFFNTFEQPGGLSVSLNDLAKICMRYAPQRILVGEVRDSAALELLKLWNTGHPGGIGTFHADSAEEALPRLEELVEEAGVGPKQRLIGRAVDLIVYMKKTTDGRRIVSEIIKVNSFNNKTETYEIEVLYEAA